MLRLSLCFNFNGGKTIYILQINKSKKGILQHILQHRHCKIKLFENNGRMSRIFYKFVPKFDLYKTDVARKKKELPLLEKVTITDVAAEGKALAKVNDLVIFVPYVVPGDVVDLQIKRKKNHYAEAVAVKIHEKSPMRTEPFCQHYGVCG